MIEAPNFRSTIDSAKKNAGNYLKLAAVVAGFNGIIGLGMWDFNRGFEADREYSARGGRCLTQAESDAVFVRRNGRGSLLRYYLDIGAAIRFIPRGDRFLKEAENSRDRLINNGHDVSVGAANTFPEDGIVVHCRVNLGFPLEY